MIAWRIVLVVASALVLQVCLLARFSYEGARPDVVVLVAIAAGFAAGSRPGAIVGFGAGLAFDVFLATPFGLSALVYTLVGYAVGSFSAGILRTSWWIAPVVTAAASAGAMLGYAAVATVFGEAPFQGPPVSAIIVVVTLVNTALAPLALRSVRWAGTDRRDLPRSRPRAMFAR